ncbi:response regulator transcription factor [Pararobbsia silviterrae]|nr:winged helix-turn-helix domain-containing protein [Pararobbsia silviterrae]
MRILCVGAGGPVRDYLANAFIEASHSVSLVDDERDAAYIAFTETFDAVILLDPHATPRLATLFRTKTFVDIVIAIANWTDADHRAAMLRAGADACFDRRFSFAELMAVFDALARRRVPDRAAGIGTQAHPERRDRLDAARRCLVLDMDGDPARARTLALSHGEYLLLECLMRKPGAVASYAELLHYAFHRTDADRRTLTYTISRLRKRLAELGSRSTIAAVSGIGYRIDLAS